MLELYCLNNNPKELSALIIPRNKLKLQKKIKPHCYELKHYVNNVIYNNI